MTDKQRQIIKKDVFEVYKAFRISNDKSNALEGVYNSKLVNCLKHTIEDVENALSFNKEYELKKVKENNLSSEISQIKTEQEVYEYYVQNLSKVCNALTVESEVDFILKNISSYELRYLYSVLTGIFLKGKITKKDVVYRIKDYFNTAERTRDLAKSIII